MTCRSVSALAFFLVVLTAAASAGAEPAAVPLCEPWSAEYAGTDATGEQVIALWQFNPGGETADASGHGHAATLQGASIHAEGRFGGCLECFPGWPVEDKGHRALVPNDPALSPSGAFTIEMWIKPKEQLNDKYPDSFLLDKKYVAHDDYQLILGSPAKNGDRLLQANLGFGNDSQTYYSQPAPFEPGRWRHVAFTYDGAGMGRFYLDGRSCGGGEFPGRKSISRGRHQLSIGDRIGSYHHGFPGFIDQVRITSGVREFRRLKLEQVSDRRVFVRMEPDARLQLAVTNLQREPVAKAKISVSLPGIGDKAFELTGLAPGQTQAIEYPLDTSLRPDEYTLAAQLELPEPQPESLTERLSVRIVPRRLPNQFPVLMWGIYGGVDQEADRLERIGFSHVLGMGADFGKIWEAKGDGPVAAADAETVAQTKRMLDQALARGLTVVASLSPGAAMESRAELLRVGRDGKPYASRENVCGLLPQLQDFCFRVGQSVGQTYGRFPAFGGALLHTEVRDGARPCFHPQDLEAFKQHAGFEIPTEVASSRGVEYAKLEGFPASRVIPDDHPLLRLLSLVLENGRRLERAQFAAARGPEATMERPDFWTFHDPAVRVASVYGSGGERGRPIASGRTPIPIRSASPWPPTSCWPWPPAQAGRSK